MTAHVCRTAERERTSTLSHLRPPRLVAGHRKGPRVRKETRNSETLQVKSRTIRGGTWP